MFDAADFAELLPTQVEAAPRPSVVAVALAFPGPFRRWYYAQAEDHALELTRQLNKALLPQVAEHTDTPAPVRSAAQAGRQRLDA